MPADLVAHSEIPTLAAKVSPDLLEALRHIKKAEFVLNGRLDKKTVEALRQLTELGLIDPGFEGDDRGTPYIWVINGNGLRVLNYRTGIRGGPYYELPSVELAAWVERQGADRWWNVDGDPRLTGILPFPCLAIPLAEVLKRINRPLLVQAKKGDAEAKGQRIDAAKLDAVVSILAENIHSEGQELPWAKDRILYLCWKDSPYEWLLEEDSEAGAQMQIEERAHASDQARVTKE